MTFIRRYVDPISAQQIMKIVNLYHFHSETHNLNAWTRFPYSILCTMYIYTHTVPFYTHFIITSCLSEGYFKKQDIQNVNKTNLAEKTLPECSIHLAKCKSLAVMPLLLLYFIWVFLRSLSLCMWMCCMRRE